MKLCSRNSITNRFSAFPAIQARQYQKPSLDRANVQKNCEELQHALLVEMKTNWPIEPSRDDRSVRHAVIARVEDEIKRKNELSTEELLKQTKRARDDIVGAQELIADEAFKELKLEKYIVPQALQKHNTLLSSHAQQKIRNRRWGFVDRFLTWYLGDYKSYQRPWDKKPAESSPSTSTATAESASGNKSSVQQTKTKE
jgi:hypothetical protein